LLDLLDFLRKGTTVEAYSSMKAIFVLALVLAAPFTAQAQIVLKEKEVWAFQTQLPFRSFSFELTNSVHIGRG